MKTKHKMLNGYIRKGIMTELEEGRLLQTLEDLKVNTALCIEDRKTQEKTLAVTLKEVSDTLTSLADRVTVVETKVWAIPTGIGIAGMFAGIFGFVYKLS